MKILNIKLKNNEDSFRDAIQYLHNEGYKNIRIDLSLYEHYEDDPDRTYAESYTNPTIEEGIDCILVPCSIPMLLAPIPSFIRGLEKVRQTGLPLIFLIRWYTPTRYKYGYSILSTTFPKTIPRLVQEVLPDGRERSVIKHLNIEEYVKNVENKEV